MRAFFAIVALTTAGLVYAGTATPNPEITHLLSEIADSGCVFHRNGKDHSPAEARDHLAMKLRRAGARIDTAEDFIKYLATKSSWTGKPYSIRCADESEPSAEWLNARLKAFRAPTGAS
ncbi:MAG: DUF5329 family protein [Gammaproteobacteria bacterium]